jgi:GNAT superfamily N-acetyltransferase
MSDAITIRRLDTVGESAIAELADVLIDCVAGGASVSFLHPLSPAKAEAFWRAVAAGVARGERVLLVAEDVAGAVVGTVQVLTNQPENQPHRGDIAKMLVHRRARRLGLGARLLAAAESAARAAGKTLLVLDTVSGSDGDRLYSRHGWQALGRIENYALWPNGEPCAATIFFKHLAPP